MIQDPYGTGTMRIIPVVPVPKPRMTRRDKWQQRPIVGSYWAYKDMIKLHVHEPIDFDRSLITFVLPMPKSWPLSKKKKHAFTRHTQKPDLDNLLKGLWDAIYHEDSHLSVAVAHKIWGFDGCILVHPISTFETLINRVTETYRSDPNSIPDRWQSRV